MAETAHVGKRRRLPDLTVETMARGFFREAEKYGFGQSDYIRFVNRLLDLSMRPSEHESPAAVRIDEPIQTDSTRATSLPLTTGSLRIRAFDPALDLAHLRRWMEDEVGRNFLLARTMAHSHRLEDLVEDPASEVGLVVLPDGRAIGALAFLHVDHDQKKAEIRKLIGEPSMRGKGYGKTATQAWISYGLAGLDLRKIYLNTLDTNLRNIRLNEELGFRMEGILRNEVAVDGHYRDVLRMALWRTEQWNPPASSPGDLRIGQPEAMSDAGAGSKVVAGR